MKSLPKYIPGQHLLTTNNGHIEVGRVIKRDDGWHYTDVLAKKQDFSPAISVPQSEVIAFVKEERWVSAQKTDPYKRIGMI